MFYYLCICVNSTFSVCWPNLGRGEFLSSVLLPSLTQPSLCPPCDTVRLQPSDWEGMVTPVDAVV